MKMNNPSHPGEILKEIYLDGYDLTVTNASDMIGVTRTTLSKLVNKKQSITSEMALRLGKAFETDPEMWLNLQTDYDLWQAKLHSDDILKSVKTISDRGGQFNA